MKRTLLRSAAFALLAAVAVSACSEVETRVNLPNEGQPFFDVFFRIPDVGASGSQVAGPDFLIQLDDDQGNVLQVTQAEIVIRELEAGRTTGECQDAPSRDEDDGDACAEFTVNPAVLNLPVSREAVQIVNQFPVEDGNYDRLEFAVHRLTEEDGQTFQENPGLANRSIRIRGNFQRPGEATDDDFTLTLGPQRQISVPFPQSIRTEPGARSRITLVAVLDDWFRAEDGSLLDPEEVANDGALESRVADQVLDSFSIELGPPPGVE